MCSMRIFLLFLVIISANYHISPFKDRRSLEVGVQNGSVELLPIKNAYKPMSTENRRFSRNGSRIESKYARDTQNYFHLSDPQRIFGRNKKTYGNIEYFPEKKVLLVDGLAVYTFNHYDSEVLTIYEPIPTHLENVKTMNDWTIEPIINKNREEFLNECMKRRPQSRSVTGTVFTEETIDYENLRQKLDSNIHQFLDKYFEENTKEFEPNEIVFVSRGVKEAPYCEIHRGFLMYGEHYRNCLDLYEDFLISDPLKLATDTAEPVNIKNGNYCLTVVSGDPDGLDYLRTEDRNKYTSMVNIRGRCEENTFEKSYSPYIHSSKYDCTKMKNHTLRMRACIDTNDQKFFVWKSYVK